MAQVNIWMESKQVDTRDVLWHCEPSDNVCVCVCVCSPVSSDLRPVLGLHVMAASVSHQATNKVSLACVQPLCPVMAKYSTLF